MTPRGKPQVPDGKGETLAELVRVLRGSEKQKEFGRRLNYYSRQYISGIEKGKRQPSDQFLEKLKDEFQQFEQRIEAARERSSRHSPPGKQLKKTADQLRIDHFMTTGRFNFARTAVREALTTADDVHDLYWLYDRLATASLALHDWNEIADAWEAAIKHAESGNLLNEELESRNRLATFHQRRIEFAEALIVLDAGLRRHPNTALLWLRKGYVHWYQQDFSSAYSSLTTAMKNGSAKLTVMFARGQVLAEWGNYDDALADLEPYLAAPNRKLVNITEVRHARAYIWGHTGKLQEAFAEFKEVERLKPKSPWLHYRWGLCHDLAGEKEAAAERLIRSLRCERPWLKPPKRDHALKLLHDYGVDADVPNWTPDTGY
jgi:tetratricopeptide (TPR) repeat protein